jgi:glycosyltransferase involved in cell wall biosynthesis
MPAHSPRVLVVTNFATHYRAPLFELMHEKLGAEFVFFSRGGEEYWQAHLGVASGRFPGTTAYGGPRVGKAHLNLDLAKELRSRDFDVVVKCMNGRIELPMTYAAARRRGAAFVLWTGMWMHPRTTFHRLSHPATRWIYRHADAVVTYGTHVSQYVVSEGADGNGVFAAENAVDNARYSLPADAGARAFRERFASGHERIVLAVSRLVPQKGLEVLIDSLENLKPAVSLVIVGTGPSAQSLSERAAGRGVTLHLVEGLAPGELPPAYAAADVFVMPSITTRTVRETWGLACNEAMCQGTPVVATTAVGAAVGGLVVNDDTGLVVAEGDVEALRAALERLLRDGILAARLGERGRTRVARTNYANMIDGFDRAIHHALDRRDGRR